MAQISKERMIAISFVRSFRKLLDETMKPSNKPSQYAELQVSIAMESFFGKNNAPSDPDFEKRLKDLFAIVSAEFVSFLSYQYEEKMPGIIGEAMAEIESYLATNYTPEELDDLVKVINVPAVQKLIGDLGVFGIFRKYRNMMYLLLEKELAFYTNNPSVQDNFKNSVQDLIDELKKDDNSPDKGHSLNPDDIF